MFLGAWDASAARGKAKREGTAALRLALAGAKNPPFLVGNDTRASLRFGLGIVAPKNGGGLKPLVPVFLRRAEQRRVREKNPRFFWPAFDFGFACPNP